MSLNFLLILFCLWLYKNFLGTISFFLILRNIFKIFFFGSQVSHAESNQVSSTYDNQYKLPPGKLMIFSYFIWFTKTLVKVIVFMFLFVIKGNRLKIISQFKEYQSPWYFTGSLISVLLLLLRLIFLRLRSLFKRKAWMHNLGILLIAGRIPIRFFLHHSLSIICKLTETP